MSKIIYKVNVVDSPVPATRENDPNSPGAAKNSRGTTYNVTKDTWPSGNNTGNFYPNEESE